MADVPLTPQQVLLAAIQRRWDAEKWDDAVKLAPAAAPYLHGRRAAIRDTSADDLEHMSDAERARFIRHSEEEGQP